MATKTVKKKAPSTRSGARVKSRSTTSKSKSGSAAAPVRTSTKSVKKSSPRSMDEHTLMTQTLVFIFAMLCIIFAAVAYYSYT